MAMTSIEPLTRNKIGPKFLIDHGRWFNLNHDLFEIDNAHVPSKSQQVE